MKLSGSQASPAHTSAGRRPVAAHQTQYSIQHSVPHPGPAPAPDVNPASGEPLDTAATAKPSATGPLAARGFIPDLATGATTLTDSLEILVRLAAATVSRFAATRIECAVILNRVKRVSATAGTDGQTANFARLEREVGEGPLSEALTGSGTVAMNRVASDFRWARYRPHLQDAGINSVLGLRLSLGEGTEAALAFFATGPQAFPTDVIAAARSFADVASRGLRLVIELHATSARATDLQSALESRTSIDIACGVIMAQNRCSYNDAISIIATASSHRNIKLRAVAEGILANLPGGTPRTHFEH
jgi:hypothetical protein